MKILQLHFCLLLWCGAPEGFTDMLVDLGQNVTLNCETGVKDVYWFLMKPSQPPVCILRSFRSSDPVASYSNNSFSKRFSLRINSSLVIHNITLDELGIYYCIFSETPPKISTGIRIWHSSESHLNYPNKTEEDQQLWNHTKDHIDITRHQQTLLIISGLTNCVLFCGVIGLTIQRCKRPPKLSQQPQPPESNVQRQQDLNVQYEEIELPTSTSGVRQSQANSTYVMLQFPKPRQGA